MSMKLYIVPDADRTGFWSFRWEGDTELLGSFPSAEAALEASKLFLFCTVVAPERVKDVVPVTTTRSLNTRLSELGLLPVRG